MTNQYVIYQLAGEQYGVAISGVESIIKMQAIASVPRAPEFVEGVTNLRGEVLPVIDLRKRFGLPSDSDPSETRIMVVEINENHVGMIVDGVTEVMTVEEDMIEKPNALVLGNDVDFITGIAKMQDKLVALVDLHKVLLTNEIAEVAQLI